MEKGCAIIYWSLSALRQKSGKNITHIPLNGREVSAKVQCR